LAVALAAVPVVALAVVLAEVPAVATSVSATSARLARARERFYGPASRSSNRTWRPAPACSRSCYS